MTDQFDFANQPHRRRNPLTGDWVLVSPHRNKRPWQGQLDRAQVEHQQAYDSECYLCPGNKRLGGTTNPGYEQAFTFDNDFPALTSEQTVFAQNTDPLFVSHAESGTCRVVAYSPDHSKTLAELSTQQIVTVIEALITQVDDLARQFKWVQVFENKGEVMGCSMPHPHGQIWAQHHAPTLLARESEQQAHYFAEHGSPMLLDYAQRELADGSRTIVANADWLAVVPYWAAWPFESLLLPTFPISHLTSLTRSQVHSLAAIKSQLLIRYDNLFECSFPYSMGWHGAPGTADDQDSNLDHWQLHAHFYPPLLRSAEVRKFMVGYEMLAEAQRDITPEQAAQVLRELVGTHYKQR